MSSPSWSLFTAGQTLTHTLLNTAFTAFETWGVTTKFDPANLSKPKADCPLVVTAGTLTAATHNFWVKIPSTMGDAFEPVSATVIYNAEGGAATVAFRCYHGATALTATTAFFAAITADTPQVEQETTTFSPSSLAAGQWVKFEIVVSVATVTGVTCVLWGKTTHRS